MLFEPLEIKNVKLENRIVSAPLASSSALPDGAPSEKTLEIYKKFAASGVGLIVAEHHAVSLSGCVRCTQLRADSDEVARKQAPLAEVFKEANVPAIAQISHAGARPSEPQVFGLAGYRSLSPSGVVLWGDWDVPRRSCEMTRGEVHAMVEDYVAAAVRMVKITGYDGVQIHCAHGYMLGQFLSPLTNLRTDAYGGSDAKRARVLFEITDGVRQSLPNALISVRLGVADTLPGEPRKGLSLDETIPVARELAALGVDLLCLSGNHCGYGMERKDEAYFEPYAARFREALAGAALVESTGGIKNARTAEKLLERGSCDLVGVGRLMLDNSGFVTEWKEELS